MRSPTSCPGAATIFVELLDAAPGQIIGRGPDRQAVRRTSGLKTRCDRVTDSAEARSDLRRWADVLVDSLIKYHAG